MRIGYCKKYEKYVSLKHCEFFNEGHRCAFYNPSHWTSVKDLLRDENRPKWEVNAVIKPFHCNLIDRDYLNRLNRKRRAKRYALGTRVQ